MKELSMFDLCFLHKKITHEVKLPLESSIQVNICASLRFNFLICSWVIRIYYNFSKSHVDEFSVDFEVPEGWKWCGRTVGIILPECRVKTPSWCRVMTIKNQHRNIPICSSYTCLNLSSGLWTWICLSSKLNSMQMFCPRGDLTIRGIENLARLNPTNGLEHNCLRDEILDLMT